MKKPKRQKLQKREPEPAEPMVFEHVPVERPYDRIAKRIIAATSELNAALTEAHECAEMRVFIGSLRSEGHAMHFEPQIYNLTHSTMTFRIQVEDGDESPMQWRKVKDPTFKDAAGQGLNAFRNRKAA